MNPAEDYDEDTQQRKKDVLQWKERGNAFYGKREFIQAAKAYQSGLDTIGDDEALFDLDISLRANLAMAFLKLEDFARADQECTNILQGEPNNAKVLYRRALAREGMGRAKESSVTEQKRYITAIDDLQKCLDAIDQGDPESKESLKMKKSARTTLDRLEQSYNVTDTQSQQFSDKENGEGNADNSGNASMIQSGDAQSAAKTPETRIVLPKAPQEKQDVMRLLLARQMAGHTPKGEAFFLLNWKWWCQWCREIDFFYNCNGDPQDQKVVERIQRVLQFLPAGAVVPNFESDDDDSDDDANGMTNKRLSAIDNTDLFLDPSIYHQQWYTGVDSQNNPDVLQPNLVRGYHYELLPREVYNALRSWYGERTPSICRRSLHDGVIPIYLQESAIDSKQIPQGKKKSAMNLPKCSACRAPAAAARCKRCMSVQYCDRGCQEAHWSYHKILCKQATADGTNNATNERLGGRIGLNNLGNTCFMNSALQSLSHATPLTRHFLSNKYRADLNTSNPLGTGGKLALAYDSMLKELWMRSKGTAISPSALKRAIARFAPRFAGCLQHDAQEFLAYLLDGLHEDLNRIRKAPYVEMPDVTDGQNMAIVGAEAWDAHKRRNDSLVFDTFYGQFQSTCVCPKCKRVSMSFDAFNHVSLEIPQPNKLTITIPVLLFKKPQAALSKDRKARIPFRYGLTLRRQCLVADLKVELAELTGLPATHLIMTDIYENSIYELVNEKKPLANIRPKDIIGAFEVDPYTNTTIHVVATHSLLIKDKDGKDQRPLIGFPFMSSFDANLTCREVWDHLWTFVDHLVGYGGRQNSFVDKYDKIRREDILTVRVINSQGNPIPIFTTEEGATTSLFPFDATEKIRVFLGEECTENFLFLSLEWKDPPVPPIDSGTGEERSTRDIKLIDPQVFMAYTDHPSLLEAVREQRAMNMGSKATTLDQCFDTFTKPERLDEHNMWYCTKCKEHVRAMKTMKMWRLPNILLVHLKRFEFKHALRRDKLDTFVDFPLEGLNMDTHCVDWGRASGSSASKSTVDARVQADYDLFAVVNHFGRMGFGHYTAFCRQWDESSLSPEWSLFDDSSVRPVDRAEVLGPSAYVLFYRRRQFN